MSGDSQLTGPDLKAGIPESEVSDGGKLAGHVDGDAVLLSRTGDDFYAIGATCTHYGGPLAEGLVVAQTIRCPWHHACFDLHTGEALGAPALNDVGAWTVERRGGKVFVTKRIAAPVPRRSPVTPPESVLILGAGAAGHAAAEQLRREGYEGPVTLVDPDPDEPYDKPNLSKDYLAGKAPEEWIPLRPRHFFTQHRIELLQRDARSVDTTARNVTFDDGSIRTYGALLIATGARPIPLPMPVDKDAPVHYLRTLVDSRAIIASAASGKQAVVIGASFIGLEVAASLRHRDLEVHVVAPETTPLAHVMGDTLGEYVKTLHAEHGVQFHLGNSVMEVAADAVVLDDGTRLLADFVVAGIGVRPRDEIARASGLETDNGILVNSRLETSAAGVYAAGDVARFPALGTDKSIRVEHWVVAQRAGQCAARNILGADRPFDDVPFFWSQHYDAAIAYVGHASSWDAIEEDGNPADMDYSARFFVDGELVASATIFRDQESLRVEAEMAGSL